jgi:acetylornithine deacetylase
MNTTPYIELLQKMIAIPSFSREEGAVCDAIRSWLIAQGFTPHRKGNNLWLEESGDPDGRPVVLLNGHIDTVRPASGYTFDPFTPIVEGDVLYGLGSNDCGGCVVALLAAFVELTRKPQPCRFIWSATAEEEVCGANGIESILDELPPIDLAIIGEPTCMQMAVAEKGLLVLDCTAHGKSGHAARTEGINALYRAVDDIQWFRNYRFEKESPYLGPVKMSVTMVQCGTQHNVVPDTCTFVVDVRPNGMYTNAEIVEEIKAHVGCDVVPRSIRHNSSHIPMEHPVVQRGLALGLTAFGSPTTSNQTVLPHLTTLKIGPGDSARSHTANEYILLSEIEQGIQTYIELLNQLDMEMKNES